MQTDQTYPDLKLTPDETAFVQGVLGGLPGQIIVNCGPLLQQFQQALGSWSPTGAPRGDTQWFEYLITYLLEYIADFPSSGPLIHEFAEQIMNDVDHGNEPRDPSWLFNLVVELGFAVRSHLQSLGLYSVMDSLLYEFYRFVGNDVLLRRVDPAIVPWLKSLQQGDPGWRSTQPPKW